MKTHNKLTDNDADEHKPAKKKRRGNPNLVKGGPQPAWLIGKDFKAHPEHTSGAVVGIRTMKSLREKIQEMGSEVVEVEVKTKNGVQTIEMTRMEVILMDWFNSQTWQKQQQLLQYGFGIPKQVLELQGEVKHIRVSLKKKDEEKSNGE